jgi:uncharacterized protein with FMN-binding domain
VGSAAVLTVYAAGYARTRSAAERFAGDTDRRPAYDTGAQRPAVVPQASSVPPIVASDTMPPVAHAVTAARPRPIDSSVAHAHKIVATARIDTAVAPPVPPPDSVVVPPVTPVPPPSAPPADTVAPRHKDAALKDGIYTGWGTSRHGDIQASVEIRDGKIFAASISQCLTRYPCSRIEHIVPQVVARQSADVDYVSGATQSANAFYQAVVEALSKAK